MPEFLAKFVSHIRKHDDHIYMYFFHDQCCCDVVAAFPAIRQCFKFCHAIEDPHGILTPEDYLPVEEQRKYLRNHLHLICHYNTGAIANVYFLLGELALQDRDETRAELAKHEAWTMSMDTMTMGVFPSHFTGIGEGYGWDHINAYANFCKESAAQAFEHVEKADKASPPSS